MIQIKRVYESAAADDGVRFLVERLWPRGKKKSEIPMDGWCKDVAPSHALRRWFGHDPAKWTDFQRLYREELDERSYSWEPLLECAQAGTLTLLFSARDPVRNSAAVLQSYLEERVAKSRGRRHGTASAAR